MQSWTLSDYVDATYFNWGATTNPDSGVGLDGGVAPTLAWSSSTGDPNPGSLRVTVTFTGFRQYIDPQVLLSPPQDFSGTHKTVKARIRLVSGTFPSGGVQFHVSSGTTGPNAYVYVSSQFVNSTSLTPGNWISISLVTDAVDPDGRPHIRSHTDRPDRRAVHDRRSGRKRHADVRRRPCSRSTRFRPDRRAANDGAWAAQPSRLFAFDRLDMRSAVLAAVVLLAACAKDPTYATDGGGAVASACPAVDAAVGVDVGAAAADAGLTCSSSCDFAGGIAVGCATRFQYGINFAWDQFAGDFGGVSAWGAPGVSRNGRVRCELADMRAHGVDTIRWWVWPDFRGDGVAFDSAGMPIGLGGTTLADVEMALALAAETGLHIQFCMFSFDNFRPDRMLSNGRFIRGIRSIILDDAKRAALMATAVRPFVRAVSASPHAARRRRLGRHQRARVGDQRLRRVR